MRQNQNSSPNLSALLKRAITAQQANDFVTAEKLYREILTLDPQHADTHHLLGVMAKQLGRPDIAVDMIGQAIKLNPNAAAYYNNLGVIFQAQHEYDKAVLLFEQAMKLQPDAEAANNLGVSLIQLGRRAEAQTQFEHAIALRPDYADARANLLCLHLQHGDFGRGWHDAEWRWKISDVTAHNVAGPLWDGGDLTGKTILLHCEQGMGDAIQFIRYAPLVKAKGTIVILSCPASLARLFATMPGIDRIVPDVAVQAPDFPYDCHAPLMSLPRLFNTALETIPPSAPLQISFTEIAVWRDRLASLSGTKIGIVWRGNPGHLNDRNRSIPAAIFAQALPTSGLSVVNLQKDARDNELQVFAAHPFFNAAPFLHDFADTAALIKNLDLILTVDTSICHLAGSLGASTWTLLPFASDWRWLLERNDSPWYPTMRLFRAAKPGDWAAILLTVKHELLS